QRVDFPSAAGPCKQNTTARAHLLGEPAALDFVGEALDRISVPDVKVFLGETIVRLSLNLVAQCLLPGKGHRSEPLPNGSCRPDKNRQRVDRNTRSEDRLRECFEQAVLPPVDRELSNRGSSGPG